MKNIRKVLSSAMCLILCAATVLCHASCGTTIGSAIGVTVGAADYMEGFTRQTTEEGKVTDKFKSALTSFGAEIFRRSVTEEGENTLVSPLSALVCLAMVTNGADNNTLAEIEKTLGIDSDSLNKALYAYMQGLYTADDCKVSLADSIWFKNTDELLTVNNSFLQANADWYDAQIYGSAFDENTKKEINAWVKEHTDNMIDKIIDDQISPDTIMYLINTLVFDAKWDTKYESEDIDDIIFTSYDGTTKKIEMMKSTESTYLESENAVGVCKNYKGGKYSFVGILPNEDIDIYDYIASFDGKEFEKLWQSQTEISVKTIIPEFEYDAKANLKEILQAMGIEDMFDSETADFSRLGKYADGNIYCSDIKQKTKIEVNPNGTKAAAVTWAVMDKCTSAGPMNERYVYLTRPFVYAIVDNATGTPLFFGAVTTLK